MKFTEEKIKYLLFLYQQRSNPENITGMAQKIGVDKSTFSRVLKTFYSEQLTTNKGKTELSKKGIDTAKKWKNDIHLLANRLCSMGDFSYEEAYQEASVLAVSMSSSARHKCMNATNIDSLFECLKGIRKITGDVLALHIKDGEYPFSFLVYQKSLDKIISMANEAFVHPATLVVENGRGRLRFTTCEVEHQTKDNKMTVKGHLAKLFYFYQNDWQEVYAYQQQFLIPIDHLEFYYSKEERMLQTNICAKVISNVEIVHIPESIVNITIIFK